ncbi:hypothetical protein QTP88_010948 [Uroleucon formosanum]
MTLQELRSFLGFANALRRYINHIASIARPLTNMLKNKPVSSKKSSNYKIQLSDDEHHAFVKLKSAITSSPVLAAFRQNVPTTVETDASHEGLGDCLSQIHDGSICIIEYASRSLKDPEKRYHSNELEVTAVHWAITEKFRLYLVGETFKLITDNYSTAYIVNKAKLNRKFARYVVDLAAFDFEPIYRAGKLNIIADHLSRYPQPVNDENQCCLAIINSQNDKLVHAQQADSFCQHINKKLKSTNNTVHILQIKRMYKYENNILVHVNIENGFEVSKIVIPFSFRNTVLQHCHDNTGHFDNKKTLSRIKACYWWSSMRNDCALYVRRCKTCQQVNRRTTSAYGMLVRSILNRNQSEDDNDSDPDFIPKPFNIEQRSPVITRSKKRDTELVDPNNINNRLETFNMSKPIFFKPEFYSGEPDECVNDFIENYNLISAANEWSDDKKIMYAPIYLKKSAKAFYQNYIISNPTPSWSHFELELKEYFMSPGRARMLKAKLTNRKLKLNETVSQFPADFQLLANKVNPNMAESEKIDLISEALPPDFYNPVALMNNNTLSDLQNNLHIINSEQISSCTENVDEVPIPGLRLVVMGHINNIETSFILDSGATISVINSEQVINSSNALIETKKY